MPDGVEAAGKGGDGTEEGVAHPDGEDGVLLSETLCAGYGLAVVLAYFAPYVELQEAGEQGGKGYEGEGLQVLA